MKDYKQAQENNISVLKMIYSYILGTMKKLNNKLKIELRVLEYYIVVKVLIMDMN